MPILKKSLQNYNSDEFSKTLKAELTVLKKGVLPLYAGTTQGGMVDDSNISVTIINFSDNDNAIQAKVGVFFNEVIGGCSCGDDPLSENAYCEFMVRIDKETAQASFNSIDD